MKDLPEFKRDYQAEVHFALGADEYLVDWTATTGDFTRWHTGLFMANVIGDKLSNFWNSQVHLLDQG